MFSSQIPDIEIATSDDNMPYHIINLIESDETLATCQMFNAEVCYGSGLEYNTERCSAVVKQEAEDFLLAQVNSETPQAGNTGTNG